MMTSNLGRLVSGADTLTAGLTDAKNQLSMVTTNKANAKALKPLTTKKIDKDHVGKNGIGMAPIHDFCGTFCSSDFNQYHF